MLLALIVSLSPVQAKDYVASVADVVRYDKGGGWARAFPQADGGWWLGASNANDYKLHDLDASYATRGSGDLITLTGRSDLQDIAITACPGGGYLLIGAADINFDGSAYSWLFDEDWNIEASGTLAESDGSYRYNDTPIICSPDWRGVGFTGGSGGVLFSIGNDAELESKRSFDRVTTEGSAFVADPSSGELMVASITDKHTLVVTRVDASMATVGTWQGTVSSGSNHAYWSTGAMFVGDHLVVAYIQRDDNAGFLEDWGDLWLAIFDGSGTLVENMSIAQSTPPDGGMRPFLARRSDKLIMTWDRMQEHPPGQVRPEIIEVTLNLSAFGDVPEDSGWPGTTQDSGTATQDSGAGPGGGCGGCAATTRSTPVWWLAGLVGLLVGRRRD